MLKRIFLIVQITVMFLFLSACGGGGGGSSDAGGEETPAPTPVTVVETTPEAGALFVSLDTNIEIEFDAQVDASTLEAAFSIDQSLTGSLSYDSDTRIASFTPASPLAPSTTYTITIDDQLRSADGGPLTQALSFSFTSAGPAEATTQTTQVPALLDLAARNGTSQTDTRGLSQALEIMGIPYIRTENLTQALTAPLVYMASYINSSTFNSDERQQLNDYVSNGGVIVSRSVSDPGLYALFGIIDQNRINTRDKMTWDLDTDASVLKYIDAPTEITVSLGGGDFTEFIYTRSYVEDGGTVLARYNDDSAGVIEHATNLGKTYLLGVSYADIILRNQMNLDYSADRGKLNDYEPTTDTFMLFLRAIYEENVTYATWKHTSSGNSRGSLIITHDVDSQSSADWMPAFAELETDNGISATYNINVHYIDDAIDGDFYTMNTAVYATAVEMGHDIGSHSVGHFPDWDKEDTVPVGEPGNTRDAYQPYHDGTVTAGATVYGELEVSRDLLESDLGVDIKTFRSGHLLWNDNQATVMEALGYRYDSSFSANATLTNFPFRALYERVISAERSTLYEFPLNTSDSVSGEQSPDETAAIWLDVLNHNLDNGALTVLLIHPNRDYKVEEQAAFIAGLPEGVASRNMDAFGDYWAARDQLGVEVSLENNILTLTLNTGTEETLHPDLSLVVRNGIQLAHLVVRLDTGETVEYKASFGPTGDLRIYDLQ